MTLLLLFLGTLLFGLTVKIHHDQTKSSSPLERQRGSRGSKISRFKRGPTPACTMYLPPNPSTYSPLLCLPRSFIDVIMSPPSRWFRCRYSVMVIHLAKSSDSEGGCRFGWHPKTLAFFITAALGLSIMSALDCKFLVSSLLRRSRID